MNIAFIKQYIKLCLVGFSGTIVQFSFFNLFRTFMSVSHALVFAIMLAIINNFYFHGRVTFSKKNFSLRRIMGREGMIFVLYQILMILLQVQWLNWTVAWIGPSPLHENLMMFLGMIWGSLCNYLVYKHIVWRNV
jgi:dolichol-phosphate mannosyltransferase